MPTALNSPGDFESSDVEIPADLATVDGIVRFMIDALVRQNRLPSNYSDEICRLVLQRESLGSTGIGRGIAIPSAKTGLVEETILLVGRCVKPIDWPNSLDNLPVSLICLMVSTSEGHANALESVARKLRAIDAE